MHVAPCPSGRSCRQIVGLVHQLRGIPSFSNRNGYRARNKGTASREYCHVTAGVLIHLYVVLHLFLTLRGCSSRASVLICLLSLKKKNVFGIPQYRFGLEKPKQRTSVRFALPKMKSEVHTEAHPYKIRIRSRCIRMNYNYVQMLLKGMTWSHHDGCGMTFPYRRYGKVPKVFADLYGQPREQTTKSRRNAVLDDQQKCS